MSNLKYFFKGKLSGLFVGLGRKIERCMFQKKTKSGENYMIKRALFF